VDAVGEKRGGGHVERRPFHRELAPEPEDEDCENCRHRQGCYDRQPSREGHGFVVNFSVSGIIHEPGAQTPFLPERQREERREKRAGKSGEVNDNKSHSSTMLPVLAGGCQFQIKRMQFIHHVLGGKVFADEFTPGLAEPFAQGAAIGEARQSVREAVQITWAQ
jgi:hypothetical protein